MLFVNFSDSAVERIIAVANLPRDIGSKRDLLSNSCKSLGVFCLLEEFLVEQNIEVKRAFSRSFEK